MKTSILSLFLFSFLFISFLAKEDHISLKENKNLNGPTFVKAYGQDGVNENAYTMIETPDGGFLIGGNVGFNSMLMYLDEEGDLVWEREFNLLSGGDEIYDIIIDNEGFLIGNSRLESNGANQSAIFKYDYQNDNFIWIRTFTNPFESRFEGILQRPNGNYILHGRLQPVNACDATLMELDNQTGAPVYIRGFNLDHCEIIIGAMIYDDKIYGVGRYSIGGIGVADFRASLSCFDLDGNELWTKLYTTPDNLDARTYMTHITEHNGKLLMSGRGDINGSEFDDVPIFLYEVNPENGDIFWAELYDIEPSDFNRPSLVLPVSDGLYMPGIYDQYGDRDLFLMKTDALGNPEWIKGYRLDGPQFRYANFIIRDEHLFAAGSVVNPNGSDDDIAIIKIHLDGTLENDECEIVEDLQVTATDYSNSWSLNVTLSDYDQNSGLSTKTVIPTDFMAEEKVICEQLLIETCENLIDDDGDGLIDCDDPDLQDSCCCVSADLLFTFDTTVICYNEFADIFGIPQTVPGDYSMIFSSFQGCDSTHQITLEVLDVDNPTTELTICAGDSALIFGNYETQSDDYFEMLTAENGCDSINTISLEVLAPIAIDFQTLPACEGKNNGFVQAFVSGGLAPFQYVWETSNQNSDSLSNLPPGDYGLTVIDDFGCQTEANFTIVTIGEEVVELEVNDITCFGLNDGNLVIISQNPNLEYSLDGTNFSSETTFENLSSGDYTLYILSPNGCTQPVDFQIVEPSEIFVQLPPDTLICLGESVQLESQTNVLGNAEYSWSPTEGLSCSDCPRPTAKPFTNTTYRLEITDKNGCLTSDEITIYIDPKRGVYVPNVFSPNDDGINDRFYVFAGQNVGRVLKFKVFDRWGELIFENENFSPNESGQGWDGRFEGEKMNPAVFVWFAEIEYLDGEVEVLKGDVTLVR